MISALAALAQSYGSSLTIQLPFTKISLVGIVIVITSIAALISTIGYWRYYELCDLYAKKFRIRYIDLKELKIIQTELEQDFGSIRILSWRLWEDAHHFIWIVVQLVLLCLGIAIMMNSKL